MNIRSVLLLIFIFNIAILAQSKLTLDESIKIALQKNSTVIKSVNSIEADKSNIKSSYGNFLPNFGLRGSWNWQKVQDKGTTQLNEFGDYVGRPETTIDSRSYGLSAGGSWTLFDGLSSFATLDRSKNNYYAAKLSLEKLKQDIVYQTTELYYTVLNMQKMLSVRDENLKYNKRLLETIQERNKLGAASLADLYAQQVQYGNAELQHIQTANEYETSKSNLLNFLSLDVLKEYEFEIPFDESKIDTKSLTSEFDSIEQMVNDALTNRADYKGQKLLLETAYNNITIAKSNLYPNLSGNYSFSTNSIEVGDLFDRKIWSVGLSLNIPVFSGWATESAIEQAEIQAKNSNEDLLSLERKIKIEIKQSYQDLIAAKKQLEVSSKNVISAEENRKLYNEKYTLGGGTILDVMQADKNYVDAQRAYIDSEFLFFKMKDKLVNALGKLDYKKYE
ncbi:MAG TPA: TolC family protein [Melioribacteraceae bacterium]|nr:TolC family protein [Melioribacteraceae bacterium]